MIFTAYHFYGLFTAYNLYDDATSVRLYASVTSTIPTIEQTKKHCKTGKSLCCFERCFSSRLKLMFIE